MTARKKSQLSTAVRVRAASSPKVGHAGKRKPAPAAPAVEREPRELPYTSNLLLSVRDAADLLGISERKMYYLLARSAITAIKIDRSTRIKRSVLDDYIARLERIPA